MTPTDALFGFCAFLTTMSKSMQVGKEHSSPAILEPLKEFLLVNNLPDVSKGYPGNFKMPKDWIGKGIAT